MELYANEDDVYTEIREYNTYIIDLLMEEAVIVFTDGVEFIVLIAYDADKMNAPVLIGKAMGYIEVKMFEDRAKVNNVYIDEYRSLARYIYNEVEIGNEIPGELYNIVANEIIKVYKDGI